MIDRIDEPEVPRVAGVRRHLAWLLPAVFLVGCTAWALIEEYERARGIHVRGQGMYLIVPALPWITWLPIPHGVARQWVFWWGGGLLPNAILLSLIGRWLARGRRGRSRA